MGFPVLDERRQQLHDWQRPCNGRRPYSLVMILMSIRLNVVVYLSKDAFSLHAAHFSSAHELVGWIL